MKMPDEDHRRDRAHPVEVGGHDAVFGAVAGHADQFLGAEIGRQEGEAGDPDGDRVAGGEEVAAGGDLLAKPPADTEDETRNTKPELRNQPLRVSKVNLWDVTDSKNGNMSISQGSGDTPNSAGSRQTALTRQSHGATLWSHRRAERSGNATIMDRFLWAEFFRATWSSTGSDCVTVEVSPMYQVEHQNTQVSGEIGQ